MPRHTVTLKLEVEVEAPDINAIKFAFKYEEDMRFVLKSHNVDVKDFTHHVEKIERSA